MALTRPVGEQVRFESSKTGSHVLDSYLEAAEMGGRTLSSLLEQLFNPTTGNIEPFAMRINNNVLEFKTAGTTVYVPVVSYQAFYDGLQAMLTAATTSRNEALLFRNEAETFKNQSSASATASANSAAAAAQSAIQASQFVPAVFQDDLNMSLEWALMYDNEPPYNFDEKWVAPEIVASSPVFQQTTDQFNNRMGKVIFTFSEPITRGTGAVTLSKKVSGNWVQVSTLGSASIKVDGPYVVLTMPVLDRLTEYQIATAYDFVRDADGNRSLAQSSYSFTTS